MHYQQLGIQSPPLEGRRGRKKAFWGMQGLLNISIAQQAAFLSRNSFSALKQNPPPCSLRSLSPSEGGLGLIACNYCIKRWRNETLIPTHSEFNLFIIKCLGYKVPLWRGRRGRKKAFWGMQGLLNTSIALQFAFLSRKGFSALKHNPPPCSLRSLSPSKGGLGLIACNYCIKRWRNETLIPTHSEFNLCIIKCLGYKVPLRRGRGGGTEQLEVSEI
jgi:hypothetical protein